MFRCQPKAHDSTQRGMGEESGLLYINAALGGVEERELSQS